MIYIINGPNLNLLGKREIMVYGTITLDSITENVRALASQMGRVVEFFQSNSEGEIINIIHQARDSAEGIIINPGAYTHYSYAIRDAIAAVTLPTIEVHISNVHNREEFRHNSVISPVCRGVICGFGIEGYVYALMSLDTYLSERNQINRGQ
ncbi:MAG: type II 3-dehydroquinate dehydratase [Oscillospiraceae bacterium]|nr:type II 3-dehydroquinate dehydratase [Oscillospiraceae bacterium]